MRNFAVAASGDAVIAVGGSWGTLTEIALRDAARPTGRDPRAGPGSWTASIARRRPRRPSSSRSAACEGTREARRAAVALARELLARVDAVPPRLPLPGACASPGCRRARGRPAAPARARCSPSTRTPRPAPRPCARRARSRSCDEPHREQRQVDEREIVVERADQGQQVEHLAAAAVVREVDREHVDRRECDRDLCGSGRVRPVAETDDERRARRARACRRPRRGPERSARRRSGSRSPRSRRASPRPRRAATPCRAGAGSRPSRS